jgi:hypothetical protein
MEMVVIRHLIHQIEPGHRSRDNAGSRYAA